MSFGPGISFGRLCRRERSLDEVYDNASRMPSWRSITDLGYDLWFDGKDFVVFDRIPNLREPRVAAIRTLSENHSR